LSTIWLKSGTALVEVDRQLADALHLQPRRLGDELAELFDELKTA